MVHARSSANDTASLATAERILANAAIRFFEPELKKLSDRSIVGTEKPGRVKL
jgi:hypothetical protein